MGLSSKDYMIGNLFQAKGRRLKTACREDILNLISPDGTGIISEGNNAVIRIYSVWLFDNLHEAFMNLFPINDKSPFEKPVAGVFTVRLAQIKAFHIRWISCQFIGKQVIVIIYIPVIEPKTHLLINLHEGRFSFFQNWNCIYMLRCNSCFKGLKRLFILALRHPVINEFKKFR